LGNEAAARGLYEYGCSLISSYPGTPSTEITEFASRYPEIKSEWAPNEKVALETAFGASLAGFRSACAMKHVGLNVAADPLFTMSYTGVNAGLVIFVADDPAMHSSQNEQDSRRYAIASRVPMLEPSDSREALEMVGEAYRISEEFDTPVIFRICTRTAHSQSVVETGDRKLPERIPYKKNPEKYVMMPAYAKRRHPVIEERTDRLREFAETSPLNRVEGIGSGSGTTGIITSGVCYQYVKEVFGDSVTGLTLGMLNPLPDRLILDFAASVEKLIVIEELDPVIEEHCRALGLSPEGHNIFPKVGEYSQQLIKKCLGLPLPEANEPLNLPARPPVMCPGCPHRGLFYVLSKLRLTVLGDIGCYTLGAQPPLSAVDSVLCMGASVSGIHGFLRADPGMANKTVAVIGDSTFIHSGITGLCNVSYNASNSTVIILDNSITGMTGHQQNPTTGYNIKGEPAAKVDLEALCRALGIDHVRTVDPYDLAGTELAVSEELNYDGPSVIISRRPCVLLKSVKTKPPLGVDPETCRSCRRCMKLGCPAISFRNGKAVIDQGLCTGCGLCASLCPFGAIKEGN
ncbi:MAG: indolepyruvate ferredoxin oxidoreductase subunit alpha, partial [Clostridia bacterium]|nr:indolepyruvate ferredoxin oxidoreductase subunit alpha [Clostridia bacterium]